MLWEQSKLAWQRSGVFNQLFYWVQRWTKQSVSGYVDLCEIKHTLLFILINKCSLTNFVVSPVPPVPANIYKVSEDIIVNEGSNVTLSCLASGRPDPAITWRLLNPSGKNHPINTNYHLCQSGCLACGVPDASSKDQILKQSKKINLCERPLRDYSFFIIKVVLWLLSVQWKQELLAAKRTWISMMLKLLNSNEWAQNSDV